MTAKPSERLKALHDLNARKSKIQDITDALISLGYTSLDEQAKALGLHRATTWTIIKKKHKVGRLSAKTIERIIKNPQTPARVFQPSKIRQLYQDQWPCQIVREPNIKRKKPPKRRLQPAQLMERVRFRVGAIIRWLLSKFVLNEQELGVESRADGIDRANDHHRNAGSNQTMFNRGSSGVAS